MGGRGEDGDRDRRQVASRAPRGRGRRTGPDDREREGHELPGEAERLVQVRAGGRPGPGQEEVSLIRIVRTKQPQLERKRWIVRTIRKTGRGSSYPSSRWGLRCSRRSRWPTRERPPPGTGTC